jgi:hypothetical protein
MSNISVAFHLYDGDNPGISIWLNDFFLSIDYKSDFIFSTPNSEIPIFQSEEDNDEGENYNISDNSWFLQFDSGGENKNSLSCVSLGGRDYKLTYYNYSTGSHISIKLSADDNSILYSAIIEMIGEMNDLMVDIEPNILKVGAYGILFSVNSKKYTHPNF